MTSPILHDYRAWNRAVLNFYWLLVGLIVLLGETVRLLSADISAAGPIPYFPDGSQLKLWLLFLLLMLAAECAYRLMKSSFEYVLITFGFVLGLVMMLFAGDNHPRGYLLAVMDMPVVISIFYFSKRKIWFAMLLTLGCFFALYPFVEPLQQQIDATRWVALVGMVVGTSVIAHVICRRGAELSEALERALTSEMNVFAETVALEEASHKDYLTGLYDHAVFHQYLSALIEQSRMHGMPLQLALLDIDNFKRINDTFGHQAGDEALRVLSGIMSREVASSDIPFRYGGEEFAVLFTNRTAPEALRTCEQIRQQLACTVFPEFAGRQVTVSIGLLAYDGCLDKGPFFKRTDELLYEAKLSGKNRVVSTVWGGGE
jgi:diguanylate cyclase (GGDEF)-like protein